MYINRSNITPEELINLFGYNGYTLTDSQIKILKIIATDFSDIKYLFSGVYNYKDVLCVITKQYLVVYFEEDVYRSRVITTNNVKVIDIRDIRRSWVCRDVFNVNHKIEFIYKLNREHISNLTLIESMNINKYFEDILYYEDFKVII